MRKKLTIILFLSFNLFSSFGQIELSERIAVSGVILDEKLKPVSYAHIIERSRNEGWVSDYYGKFRADVFPGDTLVISAVSYYNSIIIIPGRTDTDELFIRITLKTDTIQLKELVVHPWPSTLSQLKRELMEVVIDDPVADLDLNMPSMKDLAALARTPGVPGQIGLYSGPGPLSLLYGQFSKEARSRKLYAEVMKKDKAERRYNKAVVSRITGLKSEENLQKFMEFCALQVKFILESTDYELYAAILNCYDEFCQAGLQSEPE